MVRGDLSLHWDVRSLGEHPVKTFSGQSLLSKRQTFLTSTRPGSLIKALKASKSKRKIERVCLLVVVV